MKNIEENNPLVSVVIPCYNHEQFVQESIQSVIDQDYENIELIVIDDGSKDCSVVKIQEMIPACEERFARFEFRHRANKGLCATLNEAITWCEGKYISFIASDDLMRNYKTHEQVKFLEDNLDSIGVFGGVEVLYKNGYKKEITKKRNSYSFNDIFLHKHNLPAPTSMIRLKNIKMTNGFRENYIIEDWPMWLDLTEAGGELNYLDRVFASYRRHDGNLSGDFEKMYKGRMQIVNTFKGKRNYKKAKAKIDLIHANEIQTVNKIESIPYMLKALLKDFTLVFSLLYIKYIVKFFYLKIN